MPRQIFNSTWGYFLIDCGGSSAVEHLPYKVFSSSYQHVQGPRFYQEKKGKKEKKSPSSDAVPCSDSKHCDTAYSVSQPKKRKKAFCPMSSQEPLPPAVTESRRALESTPSTPTALWELTHSLIAQTFTLLRSKHGVPQSVPGPATCFYLLHIRPRSRLLSNGG